ncbi:protein kinase C-like [Sesbania bispinosa]|nr:protein kinase C-like [Sesbania bispinosa]
MGTIWEQGYFCFFQIFRGGEYDALFKHILRYPPIRGKGEGQEDGTLGSTSVGMEDTGVVSLAIILPGQWKKDRRGGFGTLPIT